MQHLPPESMILTYVSGQPCSHCTFDSTQFHTKRVKVFGNETKNYTYRSYKWAVHVHHRFVQTATLRNMVTVTLKGQTVIFWLKQPMWWQQFLECITSERSWCKVMVSDLQPPFLKLCINTLKDTTQLFEWFVATTNNCATHPWSCVCKSVTVLHGQLPS